MAKRRGRKSAAQTPAPKADKIKGSKKNPKGTAASELSAARIKLSSDTIGTLKKKLDEFKEKYPSKKNVSLNDLKAVYRRGSGAYSKSHRPTITGGKPNSRAAWSYARVNKFLEKAAGKPVKKAYVQDDDLLKDGGNIADGYKVYVDNEYRRTIKPEDLQKYYLSSGFEMNNGKLQYQKQDIRFEKGGDIFAKGGKPKGKGDCYQAAGDFAIGKFFAPQIDFKGKPYIVHAEVSGQGEIEGLRYGHAWVEDDIFVYDYSNNREIVFPKDLYYMIGQVNTEDPKKYQKYTFEQARKKMLDTGNYGSWDIETEYENGGEMIKNDNSEQQMVQCVKCDWTWSTADSDEADKYVCHKCGFDNSLFYDNEILKPVLSILEIAEKHNVDIDYVIDQLVKGTEHEMEHTDRMDVAKKIALHHVAETPDYYIKLETLKLEDGGDELEEEDLFENPESLPAEVQEVLNRYATEDETYENAEALLSELQPLGYTFEYGLDAIPYGLKKYEDGGEFVVSQDNREIEVDIAEYIMQQRAEAQDVMYCSDSRIFKTMICKTRIEIAQKRLSECENPEEQNCWNECILIWSECLENIVENNIPTREYKDGGTPCGCGQMYAHGGLAYGNSHDKGGMPLEVSSTGQKIEIEGGEGVVNKRSMQITKKVEFEGKKLTPCEVVSKINEMGGGVKFKCSDVKEIIAEDGHF